MTGRLHPKFVVCALNELHGLIDAPEIELIKLINSFYLDFEGKDAEYATLDDEDLIWLEREHVDILLGCVARELTGQEWFSNCATQNEIDDFFDAFEHGIFARGWSIPDLYE